MIYRKQKDYDNFKCIADKCPKSCCVGWQIMIDEKSLKKYKKHTGVFKERFETSVDYSEESFYQHSINKTCDNNMASTNDDNSNNNMASTNNINRCNMLNDNGLCDLQSTLGEEFLCDTCRLYPRHIEEYFNIREHLLTLSCPEVTRMILSPEYDVKMTETRDENYDDPEEFEDCDFFLYDQLEFARDKMLETLSDKSIPLQKRLSQIAYFAYKLQLLFDEGEILLMSNETIDNTTNLDNATKPREIMGTLPDYNYLLKSLDILIGMEALESSWTDEMIKVREYWKSHDLNSKEWKEILNSFSDSNQVKTYDSSLYLDLEFVFEKICKTLLYSYFCGSVYDGEIYARAMIAVISTRWIMMIYKASGFKLNETIYLYSREVEHSDDNINTLIAFFEEELDSQYFME